MQSPVLNGLAIFFFYTWSHTVKSALLTYTILYCFTYIPSLWLTGVKSVQLGITYLARDEKH